MAAAMARGWAAGDGGPAAMLFCDLDARPRRGDRARGGRGDARRAAGLAEDCDVLVLAVKPAALNDGGHGAGRKGAGADLDAGRDVHGPARGGVSGGPRAAR